MRRSRFRLLLNLLLLIFSTATAANDSLYTRFSQELDTRILQTRGNYSVSDSTLHLQSSAYSKITLRQLPGFEPQWKRDLGLSLTSTRFLSRNFDLLFELEGSNFQDQEAPERVQKGGVSLHPYDLRPLTDGSRLVTGQNSKITRGVLRGGVSYNRSTTLRSTMLVGGAYDEELKGSGSGPSMRGDFKLRPIDDQNIQFGGNGYINLYDDRRYHDLTLDNSIVRDFGDATDLFEASWRNRRSDIYLGLEGNIVSRVHDELSLRNRLSTPLSEDMNGVYDLDFRRSNVSYRGVGPGESRENDLVHRLAWIYAPSIWQTMLQYNFAVEDRDYGGTLTLGRRQELELITSRNSDKDSLTVKLGTEKRRYDSPDSLETNDRDRLVHHAELVGGRWLTPWVYTAVEISVILDHLVYIKQERSADNHWNRVIALRPIVQWFPADGWNNTASFEVLANYSVYDFESMDARSGIRSRVFRRWSAADTLTLPLGGRVQLSLSGRYDLEERGRIIWDDFVQDLSDKARVGFAATHLEYIFLSRLLLKIGYRYQKRVEESFEQSDIVLQQNQTDRTYIKRGPSLRVQTLFNRSWRLLVDGDFQTIDDNQRESTETLNTVYVTLVYQW
ncbi:hypothetical protein K8I28_11820 [bacterium]|nr:hypothetical protein [bacterium]